MSSARNKRVPSYEELMSFEDVLTLHNNLVSSGISDYRFCAIMSHNVIEVLLKKISLYHGVRYSLTDHNVCGLLFKLVPYDQRLFRLNSDLVSSGMHRELNRFPYDGLRFDSRNLLKEGLVPIQTLYEIARYLLPIAQECEIKYYKNKRYTK